MIKTTFLYLFEYKNPIIYNEWKQSISAISWFTINTMRRNVRKNGEKITNEMQVSLFQVQPEMHVSYLEITCCSLACD